MAGNRTAARAAGDDDLRQEGSSAADLEDLQDQLDKERRGRQAAESRATSVEQDSQRRLGAEQVARFNAEEGALDQAIVAAKTTADQLEEQAATALEEGRSKDHAKLVRELGAASARLEGLNITKGQYEARRKQMGTQRQTGDDDPRLATVTPPSRAWLKAHPEYLNDKALNKKLVAAHYKAEAEDIKADSNEYFEFIEDELGLGQRRDTRRGDDDDTVQGGADVDDPLSDTGGERDEPRRERTPRERRGSAGSRALPPDRGGGSGRDSDRPRGRTQDLTPAERDAAETSFPDEWRKNPADAMRLYQQNRDALRRDGKLDANSGHRR